MRTRGTNGFSAWWMLGMVMVALVWGGSPASANHPAAGDCIHAHDPIDGSCTFKVDVDGDGTIDPATEDFTGKACLINGRAGICTFNRKHCVCDTTKRRTQSENIDIMHDAVRAALSFKDVSKGVGMSVACGQLDVLALDFLIAKSQTIGAGPIEHYDPKELGKIDWVITNLPTVAKSTTTCAKTNPSQTVIPLDSALSILASMKAQMAASFFSLWPSTTATTTSP